MKKVVLSTIICFISMVLFAQNEPTKYLIKYLETNTTQPDYGVSFLSETQFIYKSPNTDKINTNSTKQSESKLFIATFDGNGDVIDKKEIQGMPTNKVTKTGATYAPDQKTVYFSAKKYRKKARRNDREQLFKAEIDDNGNWINIEKLPFSKKSHSYGEPSLSGDGLELFFTSDMPGTLGGADIFKVGINSTGSFGQPINLGRTINTSGNEVTPYITKKNILYFSSDNHKGGLGNLDVYSLDLNNPEDTPQHLDAPINSINDDFAFIMSPNNNSGYFASNRLQGQNNHDIYSFLVEQVKKDGPCVQAIVGIVKDNETKEVIPNALITLYDDVQNEIKDIKTDNEGKYSLTLDCNKTYTITAGGKNYNSEDHIVNTANYLDAPTLEANKFLSKKSNEEIEIEKALTSETQQNVLANNQEDEENTTDTNNNVKAESVETGLVDNSISEDEATINPVYFGFDEATISQKSARELDKLTEILKNNESIHVELSAYTDSRGSSAYNLRLSERRAMASADYLVAQGIDRSRIKAKGYGESKMVNKCIDGIECSEAAHEKNRRTEFAFINLQTSLENFDNKSAHKVVEISKKEQKSVRKVTQVSSSPEIIKTENNKEAIESVSSELEINENVTQPESLVNTNIEKFNKIEKQEVVSTEKTSAKVTPAIAEKINSEKVEITQSPKETSQIIPEQKEATIEVNKTENQTEKRLIPPIKNTSKNQNDDTTLATAAKTEEAVEQKFNFEKQKEESNQNNVDPNQLLADIKAKAATNKTIKSVDPTPAESENLTEKNKTTVNKEAILNTSQLSVKAMQSKRGKYVETENVKKVHALRVIFRIQPNMKALKGYKDAYVVIKSPTGKIVNEKGVFELADGKKQGYTDQTTLYYNKQSIKSVMFIDKIVHKFTKGIYTVNIFIDGVQVGENRLKLS